ncbi:MAG TPA: DUF2125 domain-containing protein [Alphaproteobacteria bacterium]|nr:DUF2125 domain-containing protein [Alphaproteobacteria bacterium]
MNRRWLALPAALAALFAGYAVFWFVGAGKIEEGVEAWAEQQRAHGLTVELGEPRVRGFPARFTVVLDHPLLADPVEAWRATSERLRLSAWPWSPRRIELKTEGKGELAALNMVGSGEVFCRFEEAVGEIAINDEGKVYALDITGRNVSIEQVADEGPITIASARVAGALERAGEADYQTRTGEATVELSGLRLPLGSRVLLGTEIESFDLAATLLGPLPKGELADALAAWRDAGGTLVITRLDLAWGPLDLATSGTLSLDERMRPLGAFTADIAGYDKTIDELVAHDQIELGDAVIYKMAFAILARNADNEDKSLSRVRLPLTVQNGRFAAGTVELFEVPPITEFLKPPSAPQAP